MVQLSITISLGFFIDQDYIFLPIFLRLDLDFADLVSSNMDVGTGESSKLKTFLTFRALFVSWSAITLEYMNDVSITSTLLTFIDFLHSQHYCCNGLVKTIRQIVYELLQLLFSYSFARIHIYFLGWKFSWMYVDYFLGVTIYRKRVLTRYFLSLSQCYLFSFVSFLSVFSFPFLLMMGYVFVCLTSFKS